MATRLSSGIQSYFLLDKNFLVFPYLGQDRHNQTKSFTQLCQFILKIQVFRNFGPGMAAFGGSLTLKILDIAYR